MIPRLRVSVVLRLSQNMLFKEAKEADAGTKRRHAITVFPRLKRETGRIAAVFQDCLLSLS